MKRVLIIMISIVAAIMAACTAKPDPTEWATIVINSTADSSRLSYSQIDGKQRIKMVGTINELDFFILRQSPMLRYLDLSEVTVVGPIILSFEPRVGQIGNAIPAAAFGRAKIYIAERDTTITFEAHAGLRNIVFPKNISAIGKNAFDGCGINHQLSFPQSVNSIYDSAFNNCGYINGSLTLPDGLTYLGSYAFNQCGKLTGQLVIPQTIDSISAFAFTNCIGVEKITLHNGIRKIGRSAFAGTTITQIDFPTALNEIDSAAFRNCRNLRGALNLPAGLLTIGSHAFEYSGFDQTLIIPSSVRSIGKYAFDSTNLVHIELYWDATPSAIPQWDTSKHWFDKRFEAEQVEKQFKIGVDPASLNFYNTHFSLDGKPFYNFEQRQ